MVRNIIGFFKRLFRQCKTYHLGLISYDVNSDNGWVEPTINIIFNAIRKLHPFVFYNIWLLENNRKTKNAVDTYVVIKLVLSVLLLIGFSKAPFIDQLWIIQKILFWVVAYDIFYTIIYNIDNLLFSTHRNERFIEMRIIQSLNRSFILAVINVITLIAQFGILYYLYSYHSGIDFNVTWIEAYQLSFYCMLTFNTDILLQHSIQFGSIIFFQVVSGLVFLTIIIGRILGLLPEGRVRGRDNT